MDAKPATLLRAESTRSYSVLTYTQDVLYLQVALFGRTDACIMHVRARLQPLFRRPLLSTLNFPWPPPLVRCWQAVQAFIREKGRPPVVLDIGCGTGLLSMLAVRAGSSEVYGCELYEPLAQIAREVTALNCGDKVKASEPLRVSVCFLPLPIPCRSAWDRSPPSRLPLQSASHKLHSRSMGI